MMKNKKVLLTIALLMVLILAVGLWFGNSYVVTGGQIISRSATHVVMNGERLPGAEKLRELEDLELLDLLNIEISPEDYDELRQQLPDCNILWNVPFQNGHWENTVTEVKVSKLDAGEMAMLQYFPNLSSVDAIGCKDYSMLTDLREARPDLSVVYTVDVGGTQLRENTTECVITNENVKDLLSVLEYLPELQTVNFQDCTDYETMMEIRQAQPELTLNYSVVIGGVPQAGDASQMTLDIADADEALELLRYFPNLTEVVFQGLAADLETMYQLKCQYPNVLIDWEFELFGVRTGSAETKLILNEIEMDSVDAVEDALRYFYNLEWVEMCQCGIPSEEMDALWKRHPETRFVWAIPMGAGYVRTDVKAFIPFKYGYNIDTPFYDTQAKELKYLVDLECLDLGHMRMTDISFLQYMPKLRFLILADVICKDFSYMADLTELVYLELFRSEFKDVGLLMNMKKLEDLNIGWTNLENPELLKEMTWLKRLWTNMNGMTRKELAQLKADMPDTYVYIDSLHPTEGGWRQSERYYEMRDMLGMFYMK